MSTAIHGSLSPATPIKDGRYTPLGVLGVGTYGRVLECFDSHSNSPVAVKVARKEPAYRRCAIKECQVLTNLAHCEEVMEIHDSFEEDGHIYIVGEMLHKNMYEVLKDRDFVPIELENVRQVARVVLRALTNLHAMGYMHCDIKPENVMLRNDSGDFSQSCMIDFGAVRKLSENAYFDIQSLWYRAPEVICGVPYTPLIDSWSVGCLLYELHTGTPLFPGDSPQSQLSCIIDQCGLPSHAAMTSGVHSSTLSFARREPDVRLENQIHGDPTLVEQFVDLLRLLLQPDETCRISCARALEHPFVLGATDHANSSLSSAAGLSSAGASLRSPNGFAAGSFRGPELPSSSSSSGFSTGSVLPASMSSYAPPMPVGE